MKANPKNHLLWGLGAGIVVSLILMFVGILPQELKAQWNPNTSVNIQTSGLSDDDQQSIPTTDGKTWIAFYSNTSGNYNMMAQLLDANGNKLLGADGLLVSSQTSGSAIYVFNVCIDAANNLIIACQDQRTGTMQAVVYKISQTGAQLWNPTGVILGAGLSPYPAVLTTGETVVAWNESTANTLKIQKITNGGAQAWATPVSVLVGTTKTTRGQLIANTNGKFTNVFQKKGVGISTTLYSQAYDSTGVALYTPVQISNQTSSGSRYYSILADADTTYFGYFVSQGSRFNSFLQRINPTGVIPWGMNGSNFNTSVASTDNYQMVTDINMTPGTNDIWSVCNFCNTLQSQYGIYVQKFVKTTGARQFTDLAKMLYPISANFDQHVSRITLLTDGPMFLEYDNNYKIYAVRLDASGNFVWNGNRLELSSTIATAGVPKMRYGFTPIGSSRCAGVWTENRASAGYKGYAQGISTGGLYGLKVFTQGNVPATISTPAGTLQAIDTIWPSNANQNVTWSIVSGTGVATINAAGLVTAVVNGTVWAKAVAVQDNTVKDSLQITITGQTTMAPLVVTLPATGVGFNNATINGTVNANYYNSTVAFEWGLTTAYGNTITSTPGTASGNSVIAVTASLASLNVGTVYHFRCKATNAGGTSYGVDQTFTTGCPAVGVTSAISGPLNVCVNSTGKVYTVGNTLNATGYVWTVPAGATITSGQNTTSITVSFGTTSGNIIVYGTNGCNNGPASSLAVVVQANPVPIISGPVQVCVNSGYIDYSTEPGMTGYVWTVSSGGTITSGQGTSSLQVVWNTVGAQWVIVNYTNQSGCTAPNATTLPVTVNGLPGSAGTITGTATVCGGVQGIVYSCASIPGTAYYVWTLPIGATIASGSGTNSIIVNFDANASSGDITVYGNNLCGNGPTSPAFPVTVTALPAPAGAISGTPSVCQGSSGIVYSVSPIANATAYHWIVPAGTTIASGANTSSITVDFSMTAVPGMITVYGSNTCGNGAVSPNFAVTVNTKPATPAISINGDLLSSSAAGGNQWYFSATQGGTGNIIPGANGQTYQATQTGWYWTVVTTGGCSSDPSVRMYVLMVGLEDTPGAQVTIYPVPNDGRFTISMTSASQENLTITIYNNLGVQIREVKNIEVNGQFNQVIDLRPVANGVYTIVIRNDNSRVIQKVVISK